MAKGPLLEIEMVIEAESLESFLEKMELAFSNESISTFLEGPANEWITTRAKDRFAHEGDSASGPWEELAESTVAIREAMGYPGEEPINVRTGELGRWATSRGQITEVEGAIGAVWPGQDPMGELTAKVRHAQQGGVSIWGNKYAARPVIAFDGEDTVGIGLAFAKWFAAATTSARA